MTIRAKALTGLLSTLFLVIGSGALTIYVHRRDAALVSEVARTTRVLQLQADLRAALTQITSDRSLYLLTGNEELREALRANERDALQTLVLLERDVRDPTQRATLERIRTKHP